jgi:hypothetical protein
MRPPFRLAALALSPILLSFLSGCGSGGVTAIASPSLKGNWSFEATATPSSASQIAGVGGALMVSSTGAITGLLHTLPADVANLSSLCYATTDVIPVTGTLTGDNTLTLTSSPFAGNALTVRGTYVAGSATMPSSLVNATYSITGPCGVATQAVTAQVVSTINGAYNGNFAAGSPLPPLGTAFTATFSQATTPDPTTGAYQVTATASFPSDPCLPTPVLTTGNVTQETTGGGGIYGPLMGVVFQDPVSGTFVTATGDLSHGNKWLIGLSNSNLGYALCNGGYNAILIPAGS